MREREKRNNGVNVPCVVHSSKCNGSIRSYPWSHIVIGVVVLK